MKSSLIGNLTVDSGYDDAGYWISEPVDLSLFSGKKVSVRYQGDPADRMLFDQTLANLLHSCTELQAELSSHLYQQWVDYNELVGLTDGLSVFREVEKPQQWHLDALENGEWLLKLDSPAKIWEYLKLETVTVRQTESEIMVVDLHFKCAWDEEHGVQVLLERGNKLLD